MRIFGLPCDIDLGRGDGFAQEASSPNLQAPVWTSAGLQVIGGSTAAARCQCLSDTIRCHSPRARGE